MYFRFILYLLLVPSIALAQWRYTQINDDFDGIYRYSTVVAKGFDRTYDEPELILRKYNKENSYDLYIDDAGYFTTNSKNNILIKFDNEDFFYLTEGQPSIDQSALFINSTIWKEKISGESISQIEFLEKMMKGSRMSVRIKTKYKTYDMTFSLSGSTKAINYVLPNIKNDIQEWKDYRIKLANEILIKEQELNYAKSYKDSVLKQFLIEKIDTSNIIFNDLFKYFSEITNSDFPSENNILDSISLSNTIEIYPYFELKENLILNLNYSNNNQMKYIDQKKYFINNVKKIFSFYLNSTLNSKMYLHFDSSFNFDASSSITNSFWNFYSSKGDLNVEYVSDIKYDYNSSDFKSKSLNTKKRYLIKSFKKIDEKAFSYENGHEGILYHFKKQNTHKYVYCVNLKHSYYLTFVFEPNLNFDHDINFVKQNFINFSYY